MMKDPATVAAEHSFTGCEDAVTKRAETLFGSQTVLSRATTPSIERPIAIINSQRQEMVKSSLFTNLCAPSDQRAHPPRRGAGERIARQPA
jgi:hypothetical protein